MPAPTPLEQLYMAATAPRSISIGLPASTICADHRFPLTPEGAERLVERGFSVLMEEGAALPIHYADEAYARRGVHICRRGDTLRADVVVSLGHPSTTPVSSNAVRSCWACSTPKKTMRPPCACSSNAQ